MTQALRRTFDKLERQKREVLSDLARLSSAQLQYRPESGGWCALEVLDHLIKVEEASLRTVREHLPDGVSLSLKDRLGALFIASVMLSPMRVKVPPSAHVVMPAATKDLFACAASWSEVREKTAHLLGSLQPAQMRIGLFRHPVSGWMTITDTLRFLSVHLQHHRYQLRRLKSAVGAI